ncbi:hypothetical protein ACJ41O_000911 [Fusarium nematophilum]
MTTENGNAEALHAADAPPSAAELKAIEDFIVLDREGKGVPFKDIVSGPDVPPRIMVIFIRHFFCPACQTYIRRLSASATPSKLSSLEKKTSIAVIGCGDPGLIDHWTSESSCPYPVYTDPTTKLQDALGMVVVRHYGDQSGYYKANVWQSAFNAGGQALRHLGLGLAHKGGDSRQNGGEFLFEDGGEAEGKKVVWCHRMQFPTDHTQFPDIFKVLGVEE